MYTLQAMMNECVQVSPTMFEHFASPMVHPIKGETISSYKKLMNDPATAEIWQTAFGKDFGGMAHGDNKTGQKGTNAMFVMTHDKIHSLCMGWRNFQTGVSCFSKTLFYFILLALTHGRVTC
jgi:hypothetical protein